MTRCHRHRLVESRASLHVRLQLRELKRGAPLCTATLGLLTRMTPEWTRARTMLWTIVSRHELDYLHVSSPCKQRSLLKPVSPFAASGPRLLSGQGLKGQDSTGETLRIHRENQAKLQAMSQSEIQEEQKKLLCQLGRSSYRVGEQSF